MFENLRKLYKHYGGLKSVLKSWYFWFSILLSILSYNSIFDFSWTKITLSVMPSLTGFTIAAFAIIFAILDAELLKKLMISDKNGHSPISSIASSIGHAVFIQVAALTLAISFSTVDLRSVWELFELLAVCMEYSPEGLFQFVEWMTYAFSWVGLLLTFYGVILVLAAILSIVRMQLIVASAIKQTADAPNKKT